MENDHEDEDEEIGLELPPGNQQAAPRALLEVATSTTQPRTIYLPTKREEEPLSSPVGGSPSPSSSPRVQARQMGGSPSPSPSPRVQARHHLSQERGRRAQPILVSSSLPPVRETDGTDLETDFGQGSLHRGLVVPSSDKEEDEDEEDGEDVGQALDDAEERGVGGTGVQVQAQRRSRTSMQFNPKSTQDILMRPFPAFCRRAHPTLAEDDIVPSTQTGEMDTEAKQQQEQSHPGFEEGNGGLELEEEEEEEEEYDEEAHMRDSAAAADESLVIQPRPPRIRERERQRKQRSTASPPDVVRSSLRSEHRQTPDEDEEETMDAVTISSTHSPEPVDVGASTSTVTLTPPPPTPPPGLNELANHFTFAAPRPQRQQTADADDDAAAAAAVVQPARLEQRAEQCVFIQIMPWHCKLTANGRGCGRGRGRGRGGGSNTETASRASTAKEKGKGKEKATESQDVVGNSDDPQQAAAAAELVDLSAIPLELVRPLGSCPICAVGFPKSRSGPAKRTHMERCAWRPPASFAAAGAEKDEVEKEVEGPDVAESSTRPKAVRRARPQAPTPPAAASTSSNSQQPPTPAALTSSQVLDLINTTLNTLIQAERARQTSSAASKTLFAHLVGEAGLSETAAEMALKAKRERDQVRKVHLDNLYEGQGELPREYRTRKKRRKKKTKISKKGGDEEDEEEEEGEVLNPALMRLMARRDAEVAKMREAVLRGRSVDDEDDEEEDEGQVDYVPPSTSTSREASMSPLKAASTTSTSNSTSSGGERKGLAAELGTTLVPAREGRARARAYVREMFPATQMSVSMAMGPVPEDDDEDEDGEGGEEDDVGPGGEGGVSASKLVPAGARRDVWEGATHNQEDEDGTGSYPRSSLLRIGEKRKREGERGAGGDGLHTATTSVLRVRDENVAPGPIPAGRSQDDDQEDEGLDNDNDHHNDDKGEGEQHQQDHARLRLAPPIMYEPPATQRFGRSTLAEKYAARNRVGMMMMSGL
ncbi:unnamed protein product [Tilletia controversa]|nr:unnamed protein product [Tilletia controversa]